MSANVGSRWPAVALAACSWLLSSPAPGQADTVDASSTTLLIVREQQRTAGTVTVAPLYEMLSVSAR